MTLCDAPGDGIIYISLHAVYINFLTISLLWKLMDQYLNLCKFYHIHLRNLVFVFQLSFTFGLLPSVLLTYIGQAAYLRKHMDRPDTIPNIFFESIPSMWLQIVASAISFLIIRSTKKGICNGYCLVWCSIFVLANFCPSSHHISHWKPGYGLVCLCNHVSFTGTQLFPKG